MPKFSVSKSILINAPQEKVYASVRDFRQWTAWSPWLLAEPDCPVRYSDDGRSYAWDGQIVGVGEIQITGESSPNVIHYRLTFLKPWKSVSDVAFHFKSAGAGTQVTWTMDGSLPFFLFFMKGMMSAFIGMDYERGLKMLKDHVELGFVPSKLEVVGQESFVGFSFVGIRRECAMAEIGPSMEGDFEKLYELFANLGRQPSGVPFAMYHKWKMVQGRTEYTLGFPVTQTLSDLPAGFVAGEVPSCDVYSIRHVGPYRHVGNPWAVGMMHMRSKRFRQSKAVMPFETYENDPRETPENDLVTVVRFPVR